MKSSKALEAKLYSIATGTTKIPADVPDKMLPAAPARLLKRRRAALDRGAKRTAASHQLHSRKP